MRQGSPWVIAALVGVLTSPGPASAHAVLMRASLQGAPVRAGVATTVTLRFNSALEPGLSRVVLVDERGREQPLEARPTGERSELQLELPPLAAGTYGLRYKVLAADGHVTESLLRFTVPAN